MAFRRQVLRTGILVLLGAWCAASAAQLATPPTEAELLARGGRVVEEAELRTLGSNQTLVHTNTATGQVFPIYYQADGSRATRLGVTVHRTRWSVQQNLRCDESLSRQTQCSRVIALADAFWACTSGAAWCEWRFQAESGDTQGVLR